ncbi:MAG TPA: DUF4082 domain-containing protein [Candidatus Dormibacteraeota bacterium]
MAISTTPAVRRLAGPFLSLLLLALLPVAGPRAAVPVLAAGGPCPCTLFPAASAPATPPDGDTAAEQSGVELGVRFSPDTDGFVSAVRFYKGDGNTGLHTGSLWTASGGHLAGGWFARESASGWQTLTFREPVAVSAGVTYVASYHTDSGGYASDDGFADGPIDASPLHASSGVFAYGASQFPSDTFGGSDYWVDVVFDTVVRPAVTEPTPAPGSGGVRPGSLVIGGFNELIAPASLHMELRGPGGDAVPGSTTFAPGTGSAIFAPSQPLELGTTYTATVDAAVDAAGHAMAAPFSWTFTTEQPCPCALIPDTAAPSAPASDDGQPVEVGVRFASDVAGAITGIRFYRGSGNDGTHVGHLWTGDGQLLGTVTFTSESAGGWQEARFASPIAVAAGTDYVASYHTDAGHYAETDDGLRDFLSSGSLQVVPRTPALGSRGFYAYGASGTFPDQGFHSDNYWVTPLFVPTLPLTASPNPSTSGQAVALTATVAAAGAAASGTVVFLAGGQPIGTAPLDGQNPGHATLTTAGLPPGTWSLTAVYPGAGVAVGFTSFVVAQTVTGARLATTTSVTVSPPSQSIAGQPVTFDITVAPVAPAAVAPAGQVTIIDGEAGDTHVTLVPDPATGVAHGTVTRTDINSGFHSFGVQYAGDAHFAFSSTLVPYTVV